MNPPISFAEWLQRQPTGADLNCFIVRIEPHSDRWRIIFSADHDDYHSQIMCDDGFDDMQSAQAYVTELLDVEWPSTRVTRH